MNKTENSSEDKNMQFIRNQIDEAKAEIKEAATSKTDCLVCAKLQHGTCVSLDLGWLTLEGLAEVKAAMVKMAVETREHISQMLRPQTEIPTPFGKIKTNLQGRDLISVLVFCALMFLAYMNYQDRQERRAERRKGDVTQNVAKIEGMKQ